MADNEKETMEKKICEECGLIHEVPLSDEGGGDDWKIVGLSIVGIGLIALIWIWVFRWGVPLVKSLAG